MSSEQATFNEFVQAEPVERDPDTLFERVTGETTTTEQQHSDGDRVSDFALAEPDDGLAETLDHDAEVHERR